MAVKKTERIIDLSMTSEYCSKEGFSTLMLKKLLDILPECSKWHDYKLYLDGIIDNVHGIELEE